VSCARDSPRIVIAFRLHFCLSPFCKDASTAESVIRINLWIYRFAAVADAVEICRKLLF